jgi:Tfp pilus assembly protein PilF
MSRNHEMADDDDDDDDEEEEEEEDSNHAAELREPARWTASDLVQRALRALDTCEPELAGKFFERALAIEPNNVDILDEYAELLLSQGDVARASRLLQQSTKVRAIGRE